MNKCPYLIIGNSAAAVGGITGIREFDPDRLITLIAREPQHTYSRPLISYLLAGKVDESRMDYRPRDFYERNNVETVLGVEVTKVDAGARVVETADGRTFAFEKLLIACGGTPIVPRDVQGLDARGIFTFTEWRDVDAIREYMESRLVKQTVVVGGGLIGLKAAEALNSIGVNVTIVELAEGILSQTFDRTASAMAADFLKKAGVDLRTGTTIASIARRDGDVAGVTLRDGTNVPCELVIFAIGVTPNVAPVCDSGIDVNRGIVTELNMRTSVEDIYAAGDVAETVDFLTGEMRPVPILPNAWRQGYVAGCNMAGASKHFEGGLAMNAVDICGLPTISVGISEATGEGYEVLQAADPTEPSYRKIVLKDDRVVGTIFIGRIDRAGIITGLIRERVNVAGIKKLLLSDEFGVISLPAEYRKHLVSGSGIEV